MGLAENAAALAGRAPDTVATDVEPEHTYEEPDLGDLSVDPEKLSAVLAWSRVMGDIRSIGKSDDFDGKGAGKFKFRGIETALNAFGPVCRKHGVLVIQHRVEATYRDFKSSGNTSMRECTVLVTFRIYGPDGSFLESQAAGEASDAGGRSTPKAQSIALRTLLINNGLVPTRDRDADAEHFERGEAPARSAESYRDEQLNPKTTPARLDQIRMELRSLNMLHARVMNETGEQESLDSIGGRMYMDRTGGVQ